MRTEAKAANADLYSLPPRAYKQPVLTAQCVPWSQFEAWIHQHLTHQDAVVIEMTTNAYQVHDLLLPHVHSVSVIHPPHAPAITKAKVMNDKKAALILAQLLAAGLLTGIWVPPNEVRDLRAIIAQRNKMVRLQTQAKSRLQAVLHRYHFEPPAGALYDSDMRPWWLLLHVSQMEKVRIECDLDTLEFAKQQIARLEQCLKELAATDERMPLLIQLPGVGWITALTILSAIGEISRFPEAKKLVGYAGLGAAVHDSGQSHTSGRITKAGRRDLRGAMVEVAHIASRHHPHWKDELDRLEPRLGRSKAIVAIARKLLVAIWHVLTEQTVDRNALPEQVACSFFAHAYKVGVRNLPDGQSAKQFTRAQLDRLGIGQELTEIPWGTKRPKLPTSRLTKHG